MVSELIQVNTTVEHQEDGIRLGRLLVEERLAACVQIMGPIVSIYRWQGKIEETLEYRLSIKSHESLFSKIAALITANHPYELPEIVATPLSCCSAQYREWLLGELQYG